MGTKIKSVKDGGLHSYDLEVILQDFNLACLSRELSYLLRKEVLTGKAKFGIAGAGKELPLIAVAKTFKKGDYWSGYYRDQTAMLAKGILDPIQFFSALYGDAYNDAFSGGRQMNNHYASPMIDEDGNWISQQNQHNVTASMASLASNVPRALGIALASKSYRNNDYLNGETIFSKDGHEVSFCIVGDATTSEGIFFESINAAGVMQIPIAFIVLDDGYGISVPSKYQTTKQSISEVLKGFQATNDLPGLDIYTCKAWRYDELVKLFKTGISKIRKESTPAIFHITECTQPQGHSTSGSHQRYKSKERLDWEQQFDGLEKMKTWIIANFDVYVKELEAIQKKAVNDAIEARNEAWKRYQEPLNFQKESLSEIIQDLVFKYDHYHNLKKSLASLDQAQTLDRSELLSLAENVSFQFSTKDIDTPALSKWISVNKEILKSQYNTKLYTEGQKSALQVPVISAEYDTDAQFVNGFQILNAYFDQLLKRDPRVYAFGEDVGKIGDVNQAFAGLQDKYGEDRVFDTGIREWSIVGQGIGMAMRGLRPIAEIQYLDYLAYAFSPLTDDLATLHYRSNGQQAAPLIVRTRGHRLEGIWHSGSPMGMLINSMRGMHILTPRNMTQAAGMYNTLIKSDDPALMIECLNGYRIKEKMPSNLHEFTVPLGVPEVLQEGTDVTIVSYGSTLRIVGEAMKKLKEFNISAELIDVQTLLPFDLEHRILESIKKTNRLVLIDEDVPGGATAFMLREILEIQGAFKYLDLAPLSITGKEHRPAYGNNGDYMSKPNTEQIFRSIYNHVYENDQI